MIDQEGIKSLEKGADNIRLTGSEGASSPAQEIIKAGIPKDMTMDQAFEVFMQSEGRPPKDIPELLEFFKSRTLSEGPPLPNDPTEPVNPFQPKPIGPPLPDREMAAFGGIMGLDQRRQYGIGSSFKKALNKVTRPFTKVARKLVPKEIAGPLRTIAPFLPPGFREAAYLAGTAKQKGKFNIGDLAFVAAPYARFEGTDPGKGIFGSKTKFKGFGRGTADDFGIRDLITGGEAGGAYENIGGEGLLEKVRIGDSNLGQMSDEFLFGKAETPDSYGVGQSGTEEGLSTYPISGQKASSGIFGKGGEMSTLGGDVGIMDSKMGQTLFGRADDPKRLSMLKLGSWATGIVSGIQAGKYKSAMEAADAAEAQAQAANEAATEAELEAARAWAEATFNSMNIENPNLAYGGRIGYADAGPVMKDPDEVVAGMDNELNPGITDQLLKGIDRDMGVDLIDKIQGLKYGEDFLGFDSLGYPEISKNDSMSMEQTIQYLENLFDQHIEDGNDPRKGGYFHDLGVYSKDDIRRRVELGYDQAKATSFNEGIMKAAYGGRINKNMGGEFNMPPAGLSSLQTQASDVTPPGMELDLRGGGFIPIGKAEKADDVPARVSKNEFVFTADAVKAAGGGSVNEGAKKMYDTMKRLESQVV